ncbi:MULTISPECIES: hypothetical protein [Streptomyces]|uniref:Restriction endonuclease n=1 Tax=Streptomyces spororaveus TaxID=284039 RepID=A0ABQ3T861_9ACTN|nr:MULTISPECIES: hypothetical protein [Streptomyces]MCM9083005.1 hypothetical protein [Streptomyces spororaveus]MCX5302222.1 hypothetical protein [Streptomyces sp. NBC_00160]GHI76561.1 hypothetical protein Sspor_21220 [Streptomyces spororaveus]
MQVKGTATGGVPADLLKVADFINGSYSSGLIFMAAAGQDAAFPELKLDFLPQPGRQGAGERHEGRLRRHRRDRRGPLRGP